VAVIAGIVIRIISDSWAWGIATFFITMFLFIFVADWIFGSPIRGKVEVDDKLEGLLFKLEIIGTIKNTLPFNQRGWCNILDLYVQLREAANVERLEAGDDMYHSKIDAWREGFPSESGLAWKVRRYKPGDWEKLVNPTLEIANWLSTYGGLPEEHGEAFNRAIQVFKKEGHLELPDKGTASPKSFGENKTTMLRTASTAEIDASTFHLDIVTEDTTESDVSNAEILEEMCKVQSGIMVTRLAQGKELSKAEINIIQYKANPFHSGAFPVTETADEDEINKWLSHPMVNHVWPDSFVMNMAAHTPIPVKMMEKMLRKLLREDYEESFKKAKARIMAKR
jgi:hypothetical protein